MRWQRTNPPQFPKRSVGPVDKSTGRLRRQPRGYVLDLRCAIGRLLGKRLARVQQRVFQHPAGVLLAKALIRDKFTTILKGWLNPGNLRGLNLQQVG